VDLTSVLIQIVGFATPIFYPLTIIPGTYRVLIELNPLTQILLLERALAYEGWLGPWQPWVGSFAAAAVALVGGVCIFARSWKQSALML
jgi:ABC-type polysaccharide/polyol phosphate export permease